MTMPTAADIEAARLLLGSHLAPLTAPANALQEWSVPGSNGRVWRVSQRVDTVHGGSYLFCPCPAWKFSPGQPKSCKHTDYVVDMGLLEWK